MYDVRPAARQGFYPYTDDFNLTGTDLRPRFLWKGSFRMKAAILLFVMSACAALAQTSPQSKSNEPSRVENERELRASAPARGVIPVPVDRKFSGVLVDAARMENPLKLLDPRGMGSPLANVSIDPVTGRMQGIKLFEIRF